MISPLLTSLRAALNRGLVASLIAVFACTAAVYAAPAGYTLVWQDDFNGTALNPNVWNIEVGASSGYNRVADAVAVAGGVMSITTYSTGAAPDLVHYTGFINTKGKYQPRYGYLETRIESQLTSGVNHAFWLLSPHIDGALVDDPWNAGAEIDVIEHRTPAGTVRKATTAFHWGGYRAATRISRENGPNIATGRDLGTGFHTYGVEWSPTTIKIYCDGTVVHTWSSTTNATDPDTTKVPIPQCSEFLYLTAAVRNNSFAGLTPAAGYGGLSTSTTKMKVDYVRVYQATATLAAPDIPQELVVASGAGEAALRWAVSANAETYTIKRSTTRGGSYSTIASGVSGTAYTDTGLTNGTRYYYCVSAVSSVGESANSAEGSAAPMATFGSQIVDNADGTPSVQVSAGWTASSATSGYVGTNYLHEGDTSGVGGKSVLFTPSLPATTDYDVHLNWTAAASRAVRVPIDIIHSGGTSTVYVNQEQNVVDQADGIGWYHLGTFSFANGTTGSVRVRNDMGPGGYGQVVADAVKFVQLTLPPPTGLSATAVSNSQINLAWTASNGATSYTVKRATVSGGTYSTVASGVTATSYMDTGRSANTTYYYVVSAANATGTSANSAQASALTAPAVPTGLTAIAGDARVVLSWNASPGAASYRVRRAWVSGGALTVIGNPTGTSHIASPLTNGTPYYYVVTAVNANGVESANSSEVTATPTTLAAIVKDNTDGTGITFTGSWTTGTATGGYHGTNYVHDGATGGAGGKKVKYTPTIATKGYYEVFVRWTAFSNRATNAPVDIMHAGGTTTVTVNQTTNGGTWVSLGTFLFNTGTAGNVAIRNDGANGYVIADAVQLVFK